MSIEATINGKIVVTDNLTGSVSLSKPVVNSYTGQVFNYGQSVIIGTSTFAPNLPTSPVEFLYAKNLSSNTGTTVTVTWTPTGSSSASVVTLDPGAMILFAEVTQANGITAISFISNQVGTPIEYILVG